MPERYFAISIDDRDWSEEVHSVSFSRSTTIRTIRSSESSRQVPGRRTASMTLTKRRTDDTEALVGTVPEDGRAEVLLMLAAGHSGEARPAVMAFRFDATTLLPPWDTTVEIDSVEHFESAWFAERISSCWLRVPSLAA